jgi:ligand-binding sensor domain-containing protein
VCILGCATGGVGPSGRPTIALGPDNRVLLSDFSNVEAVAASPWLVFGATTHGLLIYDRVAHRFRAPVTALDGYPAQRVRRAIADQTGNAVWLDLGTTGYVRFDVDGRIWTPGPLPATQNDRVLTVEAALTQAPLVDAMRAAILTDARLRVHQFTAAAATPDRPEIFLGTNGLGLVRVDKQTGEWEVLNYGLLAAAVGAVAPAVDQGGIWAGANARADQRRGISWLGGDLSSTRFFEFSFLSSRRMLAAGNQLWVATEQGVVRIDQPTSQSRTWDLPDATCLARTSDGMWVGTTRGLSIIKADDRVYDVASNGIAILSLLAAGDTVWVGTSVGMGQVLPGADAISTPPELAERATLRVPVYALARLQDTIVMATERQLLWRSPTTREWSAIALPLSLGRPTALVAGPDRSLWIGGTRGLGQADVASGLIHVHPVPFEVPAAVRDLAADPAYLWAATDSGLLRIQ